MAYLHSIAYRLGHVRSVAEIAELAADEGLLETFAAFGLENYAASDEGAADLAIEAARSSVASPNGRRPVDALFYATNSLREARHSRKDLWRIAAALGDDAIPTMGVFGFECANAHGAIQLASDAVALGRARDALIVVADRVAPDESRIMSPDVTVLSDGAASAIVSADAPTGPCLAIVAQRLVSDPTIANISTTKDFVEHRRRTLAGIRRVCEELYAATGTSPDRIRRFVTNNYTRAIMRSYAGEANVPAERLFAANLPRFAHAFAADALINLADATSPLLQGDLCILLGTGPTTWGVTLLEKRD